MHFTHKSTFCVIHKGLFFHQKELEMLEVTRLFDPNSLTYSNTQKRALWQALLNQKRR